jgi:hypothetical protein
MCEKGIAAGTQHWADPFLAIWQTGAVSSFCRFHTQSIREPISFHLSFHLHASPFILIHAVTLRSLSENGHLRGCVFIPLQSSLSLARLIDDPVFRVTC